MISIIFPVDKIRLPLLLNTLIEYNKQDLSDVEILLVTRTIVLEDIPIFLRKGIRIIPYEWTKSTFSQSMALNLGVRESKGEYLIVSSPEVKPTTNVLGQLRELLGKNVVCQVWDCHLDGTHNMSLVNSNYRASTCAMHFLAMFNKSDILRVNGWDEDFMEGQAYDDDDFGARMKIADIPFEVHDEILADHQWHPRVNDMKLWDIDQKRYYRHVRLDIIRPKNGLYKLEEDEK